jgi:hypothetical protein
MRRERRDLIGSPHAQRHRGQDFLELVAVGGGEKAERAPLAWLKRWSPEPQQAAPRREVARARGLPGADVVASRSCSRRAARGVTMSDHFSADNLRFPGDGTRLDLTDVYAVRSSEAPGKTVLIIDSNPTARPPVELPSTVITGGEFHPAAVDRINVDNDGDAQADGAFTFTFSEPENGAQTGTAYCATGARAGQPGPAGRVLASSIPVSFEATAQPVRAGGIRLFAGARSEPFFADAEGARHGFRWTGHDDFEANNVLSIALEVPRRPARRPGDRGLGLDQPRAGTAGSRSWTAAATRPSTPSSTPTARKTSTTPGSRPATWPTTRDPGPSTWKTAATRPRRPGRRP